jgi:molybdate transport system ATP-binding protein
LPDTQPLAAHHRLSVDRHIGVLDLRADIHFAAAWTVLFGPSCSGKSSLIRAACGLLPATFARRSGAAWQDLSHTPSHRRALAYAPQRAALFPHLTVRQNIAFAATVQHKPATDSVEEALQLFHLGAFAERLPNALSGGEQQRVNLARALAVPQPHLILLDEPFTGIDRDLRDELLPRLVQHLRQRQVPAVSVTHDIEEALLLAPYVIRIASGSVIAQGPAHEVLAAERARALLNLSA